MSRELPILCAGPVVRAILEGRQTQDRRPVRVPWGKRSKAPPYDPYYTDNDGTLMVADEAGDWHVYAEWARKPWNVGDVLYVRETWRPYIRGYSSHVEYRAGNEHLNRPVTGKSLDPDASSAAMKWLDERGGYAEYECTDPDKAPWFPSIHMPKWAARIRLRVLSVGVERVNAISHHDICAEGWAPRTDITNDPEVHRDAARDWWRDLWDGLYGAGAFERGDWCWVTRFELVQ